MKLHELLLITRYWGCPDISTQWSLSYNYLCVIVPPIQREGGLNDPDDKSPSAWPGTISRKPSKSLLNKGSTNRHLLDQILRMY